MTEIVIEPDPVPTTRYVAWRMGVVSVLGAAILMSVAIAAMMLTRKSEPRLIGSWISDADRTIAEMLGEPPHDEVRVTKLRNLFGKLRVTYTPQTLTSDFNGTVEVDPYEVIGQDKHSAVIRLPKSKTPEMQIFEQSTFQVIHFEGANSYWVDIQITGGREYFKRIR